MRLPLDQSLPPLKLKGLVFPEIYALFGGGVKQNGSSIRKKEKMSAVGNQYYSLTTISKLPSSNLTLSPSSCFL